MFMPSWRAIAQNREEHGHQVWICLHADMPNPRLFKRYWRLFTRHSAWEGEAFLRHAPRFCTYDMQQAVKQCKIDGEPVWLYALRLPRWDPRVMPWDLTSERWRDVVDWAPAFDDDDDPETEGGER